MAEFQKVMRQYNRMCEGIFGFNGKHKGAGACTGCALDNFPNCVPVYFCSIGKLDVFEASVMAWAAEHPEPRYPTWREWTDDLFAPGYFPASVMLMMSSKECISIIRNDHIRISCDGPEQYNVMGFGDEIPADIAEAIGVKPIEEEG